MVKGDSGNERKAQSIVRKSGIVWYRKIRRELHNLSLQRLRIGAQGMNQCARSIDKDNAQLFGAVLSVQWRATSFLNLLQPSNHMLVSPLVDSGNITVFRQNAGTLLKTPQRHKIENMCGEWKDSTFRNPRNVVSYASCCCFTEIDLDGVYSFSVNSGGFGQLVAEYSCKTHFKFPLGDASLSEDVFINFIDVDPSMLTTIWLAPPSSSQLQAALASPRFILSRYDNSDPSPISSSLAELKGRDTPCQGFIYLGQRTPPYGLLVPGDSARQPTLKVLMSGYSRAFSFIETIVGKSEVHDPLIAVQPFATSFSAFLMLSTIFQTIPYSPRANFCTGVGTLTLTESRLRCRSSCTRSTYHATAIDEADRVLGSDDEMWWRF
ncbi:hypothetical protein EV361DRAFT_1034276 [Lentinula raphanica]|nr:hypothetical protein F5880DRAFT_1732094 [Lentinula raphanica]KAJ3970668.1 hypothetical protein EV361DRAFT_1034276 [Lentinula raphanica]